MRINAIGKDEYWLAAIHRATAKLAEESNLVKCAGRLQKCLGHLPEPDEKSVVLVDASGQSRIDAIVAALVTLGWEYVIVVAANFNANDAAAVLREQGHDYWPKTYDEDDIRSRVQIAFTEIARKVQRKNEKRIASGP